MTRRAVIGRLFDALAVLGLAGCALLVALWVRTEFVSDTVRRWSVVGDERRWEERETALMLSNGILLVTSEMLAASPSPERPRRMPAGRAWEWDRRPWKRWGPERAVNLLEVESKGATEAVTGRGELPQRRSRRVAVQLWLLMVPCALLAAPAFWTRLRRRWQGLRVHWGGVARALPVAAVVGAALVWAGSYAVGVTWVREVFRLGGDETDSYQRSVGMGYGRFVATNVHRRMALQRDVVFPEHYQPVPAGQSDTGLFVRLGWPVNDPGRAGAAPFTGYGYDRRENKTNFASTTTAALRVPLWALPVLMLPLLAWPAWHFVRVRRVEARLRKGLCLRCGYDLCASTGRCPECGGPTV